MIQSLTGIILRKRDFMENDQIISILTEGGLRMDLIAKGAGTPRSKRKSHLQVMNLVKGNIYKSRTNQYLQSVNCVNSFSKLKDELDHIIRMQLILEIIEKSVLENDAHPEIYELLKHTLNELNQNDTHPFTSEAALIKLAHYLGFLPSFKECSRCHRHINEDKALWDSRNKTLHCQNCSEEGQHPFPLKYRKALEFFRISGHNQLKKVMMNEEEQKAIWGYIPQLFTHHLQTPLKTLHFF